MGGSITSCSLAAAPFVRSSHIRRFLSGMAGAPDGELSSFAKASGLLLKPRVGGSIPPVVNRPFSPLLSGAASSGVSAGPASTSPVGLKREPWQGQSQVESATFQLTRQPMCVQVGNSVVTFPWELR